MSAIGREYTDVMYDKCFTSVHNFFPQKNQNLRVDVMREWKRKMGVGSPIYLFPFWLLFFVPCRFDPTHSTQKNMLIDFLFCYVCCWPFSEWHDCVGGGVDGEKYSKTAARYKWEKEEVIEQSAWKPRLLCCYMYYKHPTLFVTYIGKKNTRSHVRYPVKCASVLHVIPATTFVGRVYGTLQYLSTFPGLFSWYHQRQQHKDLFFSPVSFTRAFAYRIMNNSVGPQTVRAITQSLTTTTTTWRRETAGKSPQKGPEGDDYKNKPRRHPSFFSVWETSTPGFVTNCRRLFKNIWFVRQFFKHFLTFINKPRPTLWTCI